MHLICCKIVAKGSKGQGAGLVLGEGMYWQAIMLLPAPTPHSLGLFLILVKG